MADNFYGVTNTGRVRDNNEDSFLAETLPNGWIAACVIDGVGGYEGGEVAAEIARETIREKLQQPSADPLKTLHESLLQANLNIYNEKFQQRGKDQMACVLTLALVDMANNQFYYAHVGDTRMYLLRDRSLVKVTKDHSFVGFLEDSGRLTEAEAMAHPKRNEISKALGFDPRIDVQSDYVETGSSPFLPGDLLLLCSDGLTDLVTRDEMTAVLLAPGSLQQRAEILVDAANIAGGKDNITVVLVHNNKKPLKLKATKPVATKKNGSPDEEVAVATETDEMSPPVPVRSAKKSGSLVWLLALLCLMLAAGCVYLWFRSEKANPETTVPVASAGYAPNEQERIFRDSLGLADRNFSFSDTAGTQPIMLGDTVFVRQDTLRINGNGLVLESDSAFQGPALVATVSNKALVLENITFRNFSTAVLLQGKGLQLRNVRFENCRVPVQRNYYLLADSTLSGTLADSFRTNRTVSPN